MISNFVKGKTAVFIDASNIYFSQKTLGWRIDFRKLLIYFQRNTDLFRIAFYGALNPENDHERRFHDFLEIIGFVVKHKKIKFIKDAHDEKFGGHHKGNVDVDLAIDAVHFRDAYDSFILLSGDGDFESLLKYLKTYQKRCVVLSTKGHISIELIRQAKFIDFRKIKKEISF
ncbi:MAG: NYN protein [Candidatus Magasanikbacteria bacterium]|nr:NYN protein [Candidatus Magasanikbacteria bacterium]